MSTDTLNPEQINQEEENTGQHDDLGMDESARNAQKAEMDRLFKESGDTVGDGAKGFGGQKQSRFRFTRKWKAAGGSAGIGLAGIFSILSVLQGPAAVVHAGKILSGIPFAPNISASESRTGRLYEYFRASNKNDQSLRNIGYFGEKLTNKFKADLSSQGIEMEFELDPNDTSGRQSRRLQRLRVDVNNPSSVSAMQKAGYSVDLDTGILKNADGTDISGARDRRKALYSALDSLDRKGSLVSSVSKRMLATRAGVDFHPLRNISRDSQESLSKYWAKRRTDRSERIKNGADTSSGRVKQGDVEPDNPNANNPDSEDLAKKIAAEGGEVVQDAIDAATPEARNLLSKNLLKKGAGGATAVVGVLCAVRSIGDAVPEYQKANIILPMIRMSMNIVATGSQIQSGQGFNIEEVGEVYDTFYDEEEGSLFGAKGFQAITPSQTELTGPDTPVKPSAVGERPGVFDVIDNVPGLSAACSVSNGIGSILNTITFGAVDAVSSAAVGGALGVFGTSEEEIMGRLISFLAGDVVDTFAEGTELGNIAAIGSRLSANETALNTGGTVISPAELQVIESAFLEKEAEQFAALPLQERLFDVQNGSSLANLALVQMPNLGSVSSISYSARSLPSTIGSSFGSLFGAFLPAVHAESSSTSYDFGVPAYGHPTSQLNNEDLANPYIVSSTYENEINGSENLKAANDKYGKCFGTTINPETYKLEEYKDKHDYQELRNDSDCTSDSMERQRYSTYLLDHWTFKSAACYEGIDEQACIEVGFGVASSTTSSDVPADSGNGYKGTDTSSIACPDGSEDLGTRLVPTGESLPDGVQQTNIRLCGLPQITGENPGINVAITQKFMDMVAKASGDGIALAGSSFRTTQKQIELRTSNECPDTYTASPSLCTTPTARPGTSMHEHGLAIDFYNCGTRSTDCYQWLAVNASTFGFSNLPSEPWHWSTTGN